MMDLYKHQQKAIDSLRTGSILCGGVGSGKSRTALAYYFTKECGGSIDIKNKKEIGKMTKPKDLYIITTARKRDTLEWERECAIFMLSRDRDASICNVSVIVDSWNNIHKYTEIKNAFFIFDEQRVVGYGTWVKAFLKIAKKNNWILLSATPGDTWMDYVPVFIANGFFKNKTEFIARHVVYSRFSKYPKVDRYIETGRLIKFKDTITVDMPFERQTISHNKTVIVPHNKSDIEKISIKRWNIFNNKPIKDAGELCYLMRRVVNMDPERISAVKNIVLAKKKVIIFYNFNYELELLREMCESIPITYAEWNGHKHQLLPKTKEWVYLVQYTAGAEGWNCIETDTVIFYSLNYSYKIMTQAAGRIDRLNTPFTDLYYYHVRSTAKIDLAIQKALKNKKDFNINNFALARKTQAIIEEIE